MGTSYQSTDLVSLGKSAHLMDEERERLGEERHGRVRERASVKRREREC